MRLGDHVPVEDVKQARQDQKYDEQRADGAPADEDAELRQNPVGGKEAHQETDDDQRAAGCADRRGHVADGFDDRLLLLHRQPVLPVAVGQQDGVVHGRAQLYRADNQVRDIKDGMPDDARDRHVDPDRGLDARHQ